MRFFSLFFDFQFFIKLEDIFRKTWGKNDRRDQNWSNRWKM